MFVAWLAPQGKGADSSPSFFVSSGDQTWNLNTPEKYSAATKPPQPKTSVLKDCFTNFNQCAIWIFKL